MGILNAEMGGFSRVCSTIDLLLAVVLMAVLGVVVLMIVILV